MPNATQTSCEWSIGRFRIHPSFSSKGPSHPLTGVLVSDSWSTPTANGFIVWNVSKSTSDRHSTRLSRTTVVVHASHNLAIKRVQFVLTTRSMSPGIKAGFTACAHGMYYCTVLYCTVLYRVILNKDLVRAQALAMQKHPRLRFRMVLYVQNRPLKGHYQTFQVPQDSCKKLLYCITYSGTPMWAMGRAVLTPNPVLFEVKMAFGPFLGFPTNANVIH
jgi:hypothetical protein